MRKSSAFNILDSDDPILFPIVFTNKVRLQPNISFISIKKGALRENIQANIHWKVSEFAWLN